MVAIIIGSYSVIKYGILSKEGVQLFVKKLVV